MMKKFAHMILRDRVARLRCALLCFLAFLTCPLFAQSNSDSMGIYKLGANSSSGSYLGLLSNSDTLVSLPFTRAFTFRGTIQSVSGNVVTVTGAPAWSQNQFVYNAASQTNTYYVLMGASATATANPKEGCIYTVTGNSANSLTLDLNGDSIASVPANAQITLIPYWTVATLFPPGDANVSFTPSVTNGATPPSVTSLQTQVLLPNYSGAGVNLPYAATYFFINSGSNLGWRLSSDAITTNHGDDILEPNGYVVVRNANNAPTLPLLVLGSVVTGKLTAPLSSETSTGQDNALGLPRPVGVSLNSLGLNALDGSFRSTATTRSIQDQLFIYNNAQITFNKSPVATYYYMNSAWRLFGDATTNDHGADLISPGSALTIRKAANSQGTVFWTNTPGY
jgi:uncharacterized protein (TIGR02597 family)